MSIPLSRLEALRRLQLRFTCVQPEGTQLYQLGIFEKNLYVRNNFSLLNGCVCCCALGRKLISSTKRCLTKSAKRSAPLVGMKSRSRTAKLNRYYSCIRFADAINSKWFSKIKIITRCPAGIGIWVLWTVQVKADASIIRSTLIRLRLPSQRYGNNIFLLQKCLEFFLLRNVESP